MVGDGYAMGVAGQVVENMFGAAEGWLGIDDPVLLDQLPEEVGECSQERPDTVVSRGTEACPARRVASVPATNLPRKTRLSAWTGRKNRRDESIHLEPSRARPPAGTM